MIQNFEPRYYQSEAVNAVFDYLDQEDCGNPLIELPTGAGKSIVQAMICQYVFDKYPSCRILCLTHQQELIKQNYEEFIGLVGIVDAGIYSAGLNCRDTDNKIIFAGIQSIYRRALEMGCFNIIIIDEAHLISKKGMGMYRSFLKDMLNQAPYCKIIGMTATPYRLDSGLLTDGEGAIFADICYRVPLAKLIKEGFLSPLIGKSGIHPDVSIVKKRGGEYIEKDLAEVCDNDVIIKQAVSEIIELTQDRKHILLFCVSISHAEHVAEEMCSQGLDCEVVHSKLPDSEKERILSGFKNKKIRAVANVDMLTTGFNAKHIDCIVMLRPTKSTGLYYQMCGRGLRLDEGKKDCLILDYAGNILEHGPLDKIEIETKGFKEDRGVKTAPMKKCPSCGQAISLSARTCDYCGYEYPDPEVAHDAFAADADPVSRYHPPAEYEIKPADVNYFTHEKKDRISMRVSYNIGPMQYISEWICIEHGGYAEKKARQWLKEALPEGYPIPDSVEECMALVDVYKKPESIFVDYNNKFPTIISKIYPMEEEAVLFKENIINNFVRF